MSGAILLLLFGGQDRVPGACGLVESDALTAAGQRRARGTCGLVERDALTAGGVLAPQTLLRYPKMTLKKYNPEKRKYVFDFSQKLELTESDYIAGINSFASTPPGLTVGPQAFDATSASVVLSDGSPGTSYTLSMIVNLASGGVLEAQGTLKIIDQAIFTRAQIKYAAEKRVYVFDFSQRLEIAQGDSIASVYAVANAPGDITQGTPLVVGADKVYIDYSGGTPGTTYILLVTVTTAAGWRLTDCGFLVVQ